MKIALIEDHPDLRQTFSDLVAVLRGHRLVASFSSAEAAQAGLRPRMADIAVVDLDLPGASGVEFIRWLQVSGLGLPVVVWTIHEGRDVVYAALKAGAVGYLVKAIEPHEMQAALDEIQAGGAPMSPRIARRLLQDLVDPVPPVEPAQGLSNREREILRYIGQGLSHKEVGSTLGISPGTVHAHLNHIYKKLHVVGRTQALTRAEQLGLIVRG